ncbi:MAG: LarC family nickel insertion protein, partial [Gemmataceae bacterium]
LASVVQEWTDSPALTLQAIGLGAGTKEFLEQPNVLRVLIGVRTTAPAAPAAAPDAAPAAAPDATPDGTTDRVWVLETNIDNLSGEIIGYTFERLLEAGALDVYTQPLMMKKQRPGVLLGVIAPTELLPTLEAILFAETGTLGIRRYPVQRTKLQRQMTSKNTTWGPIRVKHAWRDGLHIETPEYADCAQVARSAGVPLREVYRAVLMPSVFNEDPEKPE